MATALAEGSDHNPFGTARFYRDAGWYGTIPIPFNRKHPPPRGYTGQLASYPDEEQLTIWDRHNQANIALRLAEVEYIPPSSPYKATVYEAMGIDVDDYGDKDGYEQLQTLEKKLGELPETVSSSSRWEGSPNSGVHVFLVPAGLHFLGKAAPCIDIIQKAHRYMMVWPSLNPDVDAEVSVYRWRLPSGAYYDVSPQPGVNPHPSCVPALEDVAILPEPWLDFLSCNRMAATDDEISELSGDELLSWANEVFNDSSGDMCRLMTQAVERKIAEVEASADSHPIMLSAHWYLLRLAAEGHSGWITALKQFNNVWGKSAIHKSADRDWETIRAEIQRSVIGCISKIEPSLDNYVPDDECGSGNVTALHDVDSWETQVNGSEPVEPLDVNSDGLGPIIGKMSKNMDNPPEGYDQNDHGNARHFVDLYGDDIKYVDSRHSWIMWDGERWNRDIDEKLASRAFSVVEMRQKHYAKTIPRSDKSAIKKSESWKRWSLRSGNAVQIKNALQVAKTLYTETQSVAISGKQFDSKPNLLGCDNGILVLGHNPYLRPAKKEDYVTYNTRVPYIPWDTETAFESDLLEGYQLWQEYLDTFLPDPLLRHFVQKVMGHLIVGENPEKLIIFVYGPRDTGKSTMLGGISSALGDYYGTIDTKLFKHVDLNPGLIRAVPLRVTGMSEIEAGHMDANMIKRLTGNDRVTAEAKFSNEIFEGRPQFTTVIACNHEPTISNADEALQERILVLPFEHQIASDMRRYERQVDIERHSGVAVLSWLVEGWKLYCREGLHRKDWPNEIKRLCGSVTGHLNSTQVFISECIDKSSKATIEARQRAFDKAKKRRRTVPSVADWDQEWTPSTAQIYELYGRWCVANGERPISLHELTKEIGMGNPQVKNLDGTSARCYMGFRIVKRDADD